MKKTILAVVNSKVTKRAIWWVLVIALAMGGGAVPAWDALDAVDE